MMEKNAMEEESIGFKIETLIDETHEGNVKVWKIKHEGKRAVLKGILRSYLNIQTRVDHVFGERKALEELSHPGINRLYYVVKKDEKYIYFLLELAYGCPLHKLLRCTLGLSSQFVKLIAAQLCLILDYIHGKVYVYRDLKASNVIVNRDGRIKLVDFGFAKKLEKGRTNSFCGTTHAMAPEFFNELESGYGIEVDYYALGILLYELMEGQPPFGYENESNPDIQKKILKGIEKQHFEHFDDKDLVDLISKLLETDRKVRLGSVSGMEEVKQHPFFKGIDFKAIGKFLAGEKGAGFNPQDYDIGSFTDDIEVLGINDDADSEEELPDLI